MATLLNDRNELLFSAASRVTGASVSISPGAATSLIVPKGATAPTPAAITLTALVTGYITPAYSWSYRFGDTGAFVSLAATTNPITVTCDAAFLTAAGSNTLVQYRVQVTETTSNIGINQSEFTLSVPILREGQNGVDAINSVQITLYRRTLTNAIPPVITTGNSTYTFSSGQVVGQPADWTQTIPSSVNGPYLWAIQELAAGIGTSYQFANTLWSAPVLYSQDGANGVSPVVYDIFTSTPVITKDAVDAATTGTYSSVTIQGKKYDGTTASNYGWVTVTGNGDTEATTATDTSVSVFSLAPTSTAGKSSYTIKLYNQATVSGATLLDTQVIYVVYKGNTGTNGTNGTNGVSGISVVLSNESFVFPAATDGTVSSYTGSGTEIRVYEGATELLYDGVGTANSSWKIATVSSNITVGTITDSGTFATVGVHSGVASGTDISTITYTITGKNSVGTSFTITKSQSFSKSKVGTAGTNGLNGANTALVYAYKRSAALPTDNPGIVDYSFNTNTITTATLANSWLKTIPAGTDPLYVVVATASSTGTTDNILSTEWTSPVLLVQNGTNGTNGTNGINNATIYLYERNNNSSTAPALATTGSGTYTFATGVLSGTIPAGWTQAIPAESEGSVIWVVQATAAANTATATIANTAWGTPRVLAQIGANGAAGTRGSRQLYSNNAAHTSTFVYLTNAAGAASYAVKATDLIAAAVAGSIPTTPINGDTVTFTNGTNYVYTITYNSSTSTWQTPGTVIDGSLLVTGSVTAAKINSNGLSIKDTAGNLILQAGASIAASSFALPGTVSNVPSGWLNSNVTTSSINALSSNSASALSATISVSAVTGAGFRAGTLTWDSTGTRTAGLGVAMTPGGLIGHNGTKSTFAINASTGAATFGGDLDAAGGTFNGILNVKSATTGARMEITNSVIKVYDASGVLRVQLGDLSL